MSPQERRREARRQVAYPVIVHLRANGPEREDHTRVEDINSRGAFFYSTHPLPEDRVVHMRISLPPVGSWMQQTVEVRAEGRVVRSTALAAEHFGTAVEFVRPPTLLFEANHVSA